VKRSTGNSTEVLDGDSPESASGAAVRWDIRRSAEAGAASVEFAAPKFCQATASAEHPERSGSPFSSSFDRHTLNHKREGDGEPSLDGPHVRGALPSRVKGDEASSEITYAPHRYPTQELSAAIAESPVILPDGSAHLGEPEDEFLRRTR
jgi:hypothetical protein